MFERLNMVLKAMVDALLGKVEDPQYMLDQTYQELQSNLIQVRQRVAQALATEAQLKAELERLEKRNEKKKDVEPQTLTELKEKIRLQKAATEKFRRELERLEIEVQKSYGKKQVLIGMTTDLDPTQMQNFLVFALLAILTIGFGQALLSFF